MLTLTKSEENSFIDWEAHTFGLGYGTGECHVVPAIRQFLSLCNDEGEKGYRHNVLENELTPTVAWLLINTLCKAHILEYGTSPRFGWLTPEGEALKAFTLSKTADDLTDLATSHTQDHVICAPRCCNCGPRGYIAGRHCENPFWTVRTP